jgi:hypothetical protein
MKMFRWVLTVVLGSVALFTACDDATGPQGPGQIQLLITDETAEYLSSATVCISSAYLQPAEEHEGEGMEGTRVYLPLEATLENDLVECEPGEWEFDLLLLQNGLTLPLTPEVAVETGSYHQLRLIVAKAVVWLDGQLVDDGEGLVWDGLTFNDGTYRKDLFVPSGMETGIKVELLNPITPVEGVLTVHTIDFDVNDNFVIQGDPGPESQAGINEILFTPVLKEVERSAAEL